jgi:hypothetical protein
VRQYMSTSCVAGCTPPYGACTTEHTCYCYPGWAGDNCRIRMPYSCFSSAFSFLLRQFSDRVCRMRVVSCSCSCGVVWFANCSGGPLGCGPDGGGIAGSQPDHVLRLQRVVLARFHRPPRGRALGTGLLLVRLPPRKTPVVPPCNADASTTLARPQKKK